MLRVFGVLFVFVCDTCDLIYVWKYFVFDDNNNNKHE